MFETSMAFESLILKCNKQSTEFQIFAFIVL